MTADDLQVELYIWPEQSSYRSNYKEETDHLMCFSLNYRVSIDHPRHSMGPNVRQ
ncbi:hypothetical protein COCSUDRAFT_33418 [Coccomyxa subellipsoidea C-169]|uniref:Uncharacterized protein n=1 Tax=Coccomyxa subellipsoidea (strain C-169) TaxID=574566 RepID=I0YWX4_COCSC|nr:hypothetical protein COCSUDRAFT_33418 [Coccomyxa subellipsoidea C-169]EIE22893.1 hypothetical protein COCSUDRAFT_33418 [Coccomyxa subellipsoidea C-169]|eukprot:XP_005647437.1 hypothetical protein COCSUDRAFT_33418 [Coccomyxa subellipsoidea C-169]